MEALWYMHINKVYFGDMKPENLLVFRDYKVKLGDFGVSIKFPDTMNKDYEIFLKGLTREYALPAIQEKFDNGLSVTVKDLSLNDNYVLWVTFKKIEDMFQDKLSINGLFSQMIE